MLIVQLTDTHCVAAGKSHRSGVSPNDALATVVNAVNTLQVPPDLVLITGDIADDAEAVHYEHARERLDRLRAPWRVLPGNHDDRALMVATFTNHDLSTLGDGTLVSAVQDGPVRVLLLDSLVPGLIDGRLTAAQLGWLEAQLRADPDDGRPVLIALHHPPVAPGPEPQLPALNEGRAALAALVAAHPVVRLIIAGHYHRSMTGTFAGVPYFGAPSTAFQFGLKLISGRSSITGEPPGFAIHRWDPGRDGFISQVAAVL
jgi:3',5'-cyclic AMP phosphodiesterase CpdA